MATETMWTARQAARHLGYAARTVQSAGLRGLRERDPGVQRVGAGAGMLVASPAWWAAALAVQPRRGPRRRRVHV